MFHPGTQTLIDHWSALPGASRIPARARFDPMAVGALAPRLFSADRTPDGARMRLAGGWIERIHGCPLRGTDWLSAWRQDSRVMVGAAVVQCFREGRPVVVIAEGAGLAGSLEIVIAPLRSASGEADRLVGGYQPLNPWDREAEAVGPLVARLSTGVGAPARAPLQLAALHGRRIA